MNEIIGVCLGASTVTYVKAGADANDNININDVFSIAHNGNPKKVFLDNLMKFNQEKNPVVVTGRKFRKMVKLNTISEPEATEIAFKHIRKSNEDYTAIASLGGETFMVYTLDDERRISNVITKNQCASGTGEFFLQQIKRMNLGIDEVAGISKEDEPFRVSGRCSVFCKSDCTHALNKGVPKSNVTSGLAMMMAEKVEELLKKVKDGKVLIVGGVTKNQLVMDFLKEKNSGIDIPLEANYFEALGAAIYGITNKVKPLKSFSDVFVGKDSSFVFLNPLEEYKEKVTFKEMERADALPGDECILGLDVGSTTTKAVLIRTSDSRIVASVYLYTHGNPLKAAKECYATLIEQVPEDIHIIGLGATGSGRQIAGLHALTDGIFNEIVAHASAAVFFDEKVDTIFEIGGQDAKYTYIVNKVPADYAMNEACSAGTGSFIEESAYESMGIDVKDIEEIAMRGDRPPNFSDQCAAFISSDIKTALQENIDRDNVVAGLVYSICLNYVNRVKGNRPIGNKIFMQGGVCYNKAIPIAMAALTGADIIVPPEPGLMGAFGVALEVKEKIGLGLLKKKDFFLHELAAREAKYRDPFTCKGGKEKCDLRCSINMIEIQGKKYPFGGACNKYYNLMNNSEVEVEHYDYVQKRRDLMFRKYAPKADLPDNAPTVGINLAFMTYTLYPLLYNYFTELGFRVVLPDGPDEEGLEREMTSFCYPGQLALCNFNNLVNKNPDYIFMPSYAEMHVQKEDHYTLEHNSTCVFVLAEPFYMKQAYKDYELVEKRVISPTMNMASGFGAEEKKFINAVVQMGFKDKTEAAKAFKKAVALQNEFVDEMFAMGKKFLAELEKDPDAMAMVLVGRPYNSFTELANKGIPRKYASRGIYIIPYDMFDYRDEKLDDDMFWEGGKKILKMAKIIKRHPQLFATYVSNFSCGPDSLIIPTFRKIMGSKPSLTLELDSHSADAGINTRIDAALDIINNYRKIQESIKDPDNKGFTPAQIVFEEDGPKFIASDGTKVLLSNNKVDILIPSMGDIAADLFSAGIRSLGFNARPMPEGNPDILKYARANATGKECLPLLLLSGTMIDYLENRWDKEQYVAFFNVQAAGNCRLGQYPVFLKNLIHQKKYENVANLVLINEDGFAGFGADFAKRGINTIIASDVLDDVRAAILANAKNPDSGLLIFEEEMENLVFETEHNPDRFLDALNDMAQNLKDRIPAARPIRQSKYIALVGEMYVRREHFSHKYLDRRFAKKGFVVKSAYLSEWLYYTDYLIGKNLIEPDRSIKKKLEREIRVAYMRNAEKKIKKALEKSGYYEFRKTDIDALIESSKNIIPQEYRGEPGLILGVALHESIDDYCGIINVGPFGCMPTRVTEAVAVPEMNIEGKIKAERINKPSYSLPEEIFNGKMNIPFLTIETDGNVYPQVIEARLETFVLQADRVDKKMKEYRKSKRSRVRKIFGKNGKSKNGNGAVKEINVINNFALEQKKK